jgi:protein RecA
MGKALETQLAKMKKKYGDTAVFKGNDKIALKVDTIPTGSLALDAALLVGGYPKGRIIEVSGPEAGGKCNGADTIVFTEEGMLEIQEIVPEDVQPDCCQESQIEIFGREGPENISHVYNGGFTDTLRIKTRFGFEISGTPEHPVIILDTQGNIRWERFDQIKQGTYVAIQKNQRYFGRSIDISGFEFDLKGCSQTTQETVIPTELTGDLAEFLGYLLAEGHLNCERRFTISNGSKQIRDRIVHLSEKLFNYLPKERGVDFCFNNAKLTAFVRFLGFERVLSNGKKIPLPIRKAPQDIVSAFLRAYFDGDGNIEFKNEDNHQHIEVTSASKELIRQLQVVLLNFGIVSCRNTYLNRKYRRLYPRLSSFGTNLDLVESQGGFGLDYKKKALDDYIGSDRNDSRDVLPHLSCKIEALKVRAQEQWFTASKEDRDTNRSVLAYTDPSYYSIHNMNKAALRKFLSFYHPLSDFPEYKELEALSTNDILWEPVEKIEEDREQVYDLTVPETHSFFANGFISHNTFLCLMAIKEAQKAGKVCAFIDAEHTLDRDWLTRLGINVGELYVFRPDFFEDALNMILDLAKTGEVDLVVFDSVPALPTKAEAKKEIGQATVGTHAKILTTAMRQMTPLFHQKGMTGLFINQLRDKIGEMWGDPETTPGGRALKHHASVRVRVARVGGSTVKEGSKAIGHRVRARVVKNKTSTAQSFSVEFPIYYLSGIDTVDEINTVGIQTGVIERINKSTYSVNGQQIKGKDNVAAYLKENPGVIEQLAAQVKEAVRNGVVVAEEPTDEVLDGEVLDSDLTMEDEEFLSLEE